MSDRLIPCKNVDYIGIPLELRYTLGALHRIERVLGRGVKLDAAGCLPMLDFRAMIWACGDQAVTLETLGEQIKVQHLGRLILDLATLVRSSTIPVHSAGSGDGEPGKMDWMDLWAIGKVDMNLTDAEFWSLTPALFYQLLTRVRRKYGIEEELTPEERSKAVLEKVIAINSAMGGRDLRGVK